MDAQLKERWVEALRSGEYHQAEGMLHDEADGGYCCLGVLCKVIGAEFGTGVIVREDDEGGMRYDTYDHVPVLNDRVLSRNDDEELSASFCKEIGIPDQSVLVQLNDGKGNLGAPDYVPGKPFSDIADYIEKNL